MYFKKPFTVKDQLDIRGKILSQRTKLILHDADRLLRNKPKLTMEEIEKRVREKDKEENS